MRADDVRIGVEVVKRLVDSWIELAVKQIVPSTRNQIPEETPRVETECFHHPVRTGGVVQRLIELHSGRNGPFGKPLSAAAAQEARVTILMKIDDRVDAAAPRLVGTSREIVQIFLYLLSLE